MKKLILIILSICFIEICSAQTSFNLNTNIPNSKVVLSIDTTNGLAEIQGKTYTVRAALNEYEKNYLSEGCEWIVLRSPGRTTLITMVGEKYGAYYTVSDGKTKYYSLWEIWNKRIKG